MFEELLIMIGFVVISAISSYLLLKFAPEPLYTIIKFFAAIGIIIHELTHVLMCLITKTPIKRIILLEKVNRIGNRKDEFNYGGKVLVDDFSKLKFLQALLIGLAPIYISFWLFLFLLQQIILMELDVLLFYISIFIMISIFLGAAPSFADLSLIPKAFNNDPTYSLYQTFILLLSFGTIWLISSAYQVIYLHEIIFYSIVFLTYYVLKYLFRGIKGLIHLLVRNINRRRSTLYRLQKSERKINW